jgi:hypothetical protein
MVEFQISEADAITSPFSLVQQWVRIDRLSIAGVTMENKACGLLQSKHDIKELLA